MTVAGQAKGGQREHVPRYVVIPSEGRNPSLSSRLQGPRSLTSFGMTKTQEHGITNAAKRPLPSAAVALSFAVTLSFLDNSSVYADRKFQTVHDAKQFVD